MKGQPKAWVVFNALGYQCSWILAMVFAGKGLEWFAALIVGGFLGLHLILTHRIKSDLWVMGVFLAIGFLIEFLNVKLGVLVFSWPYLSLFGVPVWLLSVWLSFAVLFGVTLRWMSGRYVLGSVLGAVFGPLSYWSGVRLGVAVFPEFWVSMGVLSVVWAVGMPVFLGVLKKVYGNEY